MLVKFIVFIVFFLILVIFISVLIWVILVHQVKLNKNGKCYLGKYII